MVGPIALNSTAELLSQPAHHLVRGIVDIIHHRFKCLYTRWAQRGGERDLEAGAQLI